MLIPFLESFSKEVDISFMEFSQYCQKPCLLFDLGIMLTVIQEKVGIDESYENNCWVCTAFPHKSSCCGCHAKLSNEIIVYLKYNCYLLISKFDVGMFGQYFWKSQFLA